LAGNDGFNPVGHVLAQAPATDPIYVVPNAPLGALAAGVVANAGGSQAHLNMQPSLVLNFCIALQGIFPSPN
jgi:microcystin-dependent protein